MKKKLTARQQELFDLLDKGLTPTEAGKKAKPPISGNAVHMAIRRIEEKGHKPRVKKSTRGRKPGKRGPGRPRKEPTPSNPTYTSGSELLDKINGRITSDIEEIDTTIASNDEARKAAEEMVERLTAENAQLGTAKERLEAIEG